jgi:hypothetical protein
MVLSKSKVKRNPHSVTFLPLLVKYVTASWIQFVRIRTFSIQSGVGANLAAVVDPSFFLVYTEQLIKWWCEVGPCRVFLLITGLIAWAISKVCNILSYHYLLQYEISLKTKTFSVFKSGNKESTFRQFADMLFGILTPLHSWVVFTPSLSFLDENQNHEWKTNGAHPKIDHLEFGDMYRYDKKNYDYNNFKNTTVFFNHPLMITFNTYQCNTISPQIIILLSIDYNNQYLPI